MAEETGEGSTTDVVEGYDPKVNWVIPNRVDFMTFIGKDVLVVAQDIYIVFYHLKNNTELVYVANNVEAGDGVDVVAGHKTYMFAFAEKVKNARIFIVTYPHFDIIAELKDTDVNRYKGLCFVEGDLVAGFSGFPNYLISIWSWRTNQRLISLPTGVIRRSQIFMPSRSHMLVCECWGEGLIVWEVAQCYKKCFMMRRAKQEASGWKVSEPPLIAVAWSNEGQLYAIDPNAHLYSLTSDGIGMVTNLEWSENLKGTHKANMCAFQNGLLIYGPDKYIRALKKADTKWKVVWQFEPWEELTRLISNSAGDVACAWTHSGLVYRLAGESEEKIEVTPVFYKQRNITNIQMIPPENKYIATMNDRGTLCIYEVETGALVIYHRIEGDDITFTVSPVDPIIAITGNVGNNYGLALYSIGEPEELHEHVEEESEVDAEKSETNLKMQLLKVTSVCLTHQIVSRVVFSLTGRHLIAAAMPAGHIFIYNVSQDYKLTLVRYTELGRTLIDCCLMKVGDAMRAFCLILFSDKYCIGERIVCINVETGKDNKFAGKMQGPYSKLLPLATPDTMLAIPHLTRQYHVLKLTADKGVTVTVRMGPIIDSCHELRQFDGVFTSTALLTFSCDGNVVLRKPDGTDKLDLKLCVSHRYGVGVQCVTLGGDVLAHMSGGGAALTSLKGIKTQPPQRPTLVENMPNKNNMIGIVGFDDKNYLELQEEKKVREEAMDHKVERDAIAKGVETIRTRLVALLEENLVEPPLHQLSLSEFNLHLEHKKERYRQAEREREEVRLKTEALIRAQDKVTAWIRSQCWDTMLTPRVKLFAIFSYYQVENYAVLPSQRDTWPELRQIEALRAIEMEKDDDLFRPWEEAGLGERGASNIEVTGASTGSILSSGAAGGGVEGSTTDMHVEEGFNWRECLSRALVASGASRIIQIPKFTIPQVLAHSFLQMNFMQHISKLTVQNLRLWYNKQFDDLMNQKKREVNLVQERNARLRFIVEELNKLSDLRGSFHHLVIDIKDPEWRQEEQPHKLIKVEPEECSVEPYISPSQIVVIPPDPGPKDDFRERALMDMMDGVLEKLWHEEIKKPIPMPQCMLDKDPEHFTEDDLRLVFDYEAKVAHRNEERDKYRKMLHAEYAKLSQLLNEGIVKFNLKVKDMWLTKLKTDSVIGQENLNLMRLRRVNLDRVENAEKIEGLRDLAARWTDEADFLLSELALIQEQATEVQAAYDALTLKDKYMERTFKNHFADLSPIIVDQCFKFFRKRPKWQARASMTPVILYELATAVLTGVKPPLLHSDCIEYFKGVEQLDLISNMPPVMDEGLWATMIKLRRAKIENEIRMRGMALESAYVEGAGALWTRAVAARRAQLTAAHTHMQALRELVERDARNKTLQLVIPAGQVEITTRGHVEDFEDATLIPKDDVDKINNLILRVGEMKLRMMRKQMDFRKGILSKEWEHAQMKMKLRHMEQELNSYKKIKIPKELQVFLKNKELGVTEEQDYLRMEKEMEASKMSINTVLNQQIHRVEDIELKINAVSLQIEDVEKLISKLNVKVSEKRLKEDPLQPIRVRKIFKNRMDTLVMRSNLIREVQANHTSIVLLQTELELLRLKTYPTLATFKTFT